VVQVEPLTTIAEARAAEDGYPVELTGVVTVTNGPDGQIDYRNAYLQDATGGILIRMPTDSVVELGDSITVTGTTGTFAVERQVNVDADGITRHGTGTVPDPRVVTPADLEAGSYQGELAKFEGVTVTSISGGTVMVTDGTDTTTVYVDSDTEIDVDATFTVGNSYDIVGVMSVYNDTYELKPRQQSDITAN
jgi:DNA/RNA endonuclease YhcR with UshA esterase domain